MGYIVILSDVVDAMIQDESGQTPLDIIMEASGLSYDEIISGADEVQTLNFYSEPVYSPTNDELEEYYSR